MINVAVVVLDTLRKDAFDEHFDWLPGIRFEDAWAPGGWTVPVHAALFGGAYPSELGVYAKAQSLTCERPVLAERLSRAGYATRGFSANANICGTFAFDRGFDEFETSWRDSGRDADVLDWGAFLSETQDEGTVRRYLHALYRCVASDVDTLKSLEYGLRRKLYDLGYRDLAGFPDGAKVALDLFRDTDFGTDEFLFVNLAEPHAPYDPPKSYRTVEIDTKSPSIRHSLYDDPDEDPADIRQAYDDCVRYLSEVYRDVFATLADDFDYVITLSDHGEMFGTDGLWEHNYGLYPELTHVPLTVYRGREEFERREETVNVLDVHRTVLDLAGCEDAPSRGQNLLDAPESREYLAERHGLRTVEMTHLRNTGVPEQDVLRFDREFRGIVRPGGFYSWETLDGYKTHGDGDLDDAKERLERAFDELDTADVALDDDDPEVPPDVQDRLEYLGYA